MVHFGIILYLTVELGRLSKSGLPYLVVLAAISFLILSLTNFGFMFDLRLVTCTVPHGWSLFRGGKTTLHPLTKTHAHTHTHTHMHARTHTRMHTHTHTHTRTRAVSGKIEVFRLTVLLLIDLVLTQQNYSSGT